MKQRKAILYVRVSTDEQAEKGHSLAHQEEKLRSYCAYQGIEVVGFYKEDHSAKTFERPQFKVILEFLKKNKGAANILLFLKWDRFSRNAPEAYSMIGRLNKMGVEPQAVEQPLNLEIPEQKFMLALYLTAPEVENDRRALNVIAGIRRAMKEGRYIGALPAGYKRSRDERNKPCIIPDEKQAALVVEAYELMAIGHYHVDMLRTTMNKRGLKVARSAFYEFLRNPVYIGKVRIPAYKDECEILANGSHKPLLPTALFYSVQDLLDGRRRKNLPTANCQHEELPLRGFLQCAKCGGKLTGSASTGRSARYFYYHCKGKCNERFRAADAHESFYEFLLSISQSKKALQSLERVLSGANSKDDKERTAELQRTNKELETCRTRLASAQTLMLDGQLDPADYREIKARIEPEMERLKSKQTDLSGDGKDESEMLEYGFDFLRNLPKLFTSAALDDKQRILGSTFPEKLIIENGKCRTATGDNVLMLIANGDAGSNKKPDRKKDESLCLSGKVEASGEMSNFFEIDLEAFNLFSYSPKSDSSRP